MCLLQVFLHKQGSYEIGFSNQTTDEKQSKQLLISYVPEPAIFRQISQKFWMKKN